MNYLNYVLNEMVDELSNDNLFTEKATTEQYRLSKFKQKYHYDPTNKTIVVNGETYKVDLDNYKSGTVPIRNNDGSICRNANGKVACTIRHMSVQTSSDDPIITFDEDFFKLKNTKRMDAMLQHEIGHSKMHSMNPKSSHIDTSIISSEQFAEFVKTNWKDVEDQITENFKDIMGRVPTREEKKWIQEQTQDYFERRKKEYMQLSTDDSKKKIRDDMIKIARKYEKRLESSHANTKEFEADRYAANRTSEKDVKRAIRDSYKQGETDRALNKQIRAKNKINKDKAKEGESYIQYDASKDNRDLLKKEIHKAGSADMKARSKALKDKDLRDSKIYK